MAAVRRDRDATRRRLLDAGRRAFARHGYAGASVQGILEDAGVTPPVLYHHFGSKSGLFCAVADEVYGVFLSALSEATAPAQTLDDALDRMLGAAGRIHTSDPTLAPMALAVQLDAHRDADLRDGLSTTLGAFRAYVEDVAALESAPPTLPPRRPLVLAVTGLLNGLCTLAVTLRDPGEFALAAEALRQVVVAARD